MKITTKLKSKQQLMSLPIFEREYNDKLWFEDFFVSEYMLNKGTSELHWNKEFKSLSDGEKYIYNLEWLDTLTFTDDSNRFAFELQIDGLKVTVKPIYVFEVAKLSFKDKFSLRVSVHSYCSTALYDNMLALVRGSATTKNFKSQKELTKFIGRLCRATL